MENTYWLGRERSAMAMARGAVGAEARLIHYELAGRYSIAAAQSAAHAQPGLATGARAVLHLAAPTLPLQAEPQSGGGPAIRREAR